jgi:hypothetical protein
MDEHDYVGAKEFEVENVYLADVDWNDWFVSATATSRER